MLFLIYVSTVKMRKYFILCELIGVFWGRKSVVGILFRSHAFWPKESRKKIHHLSSITILVKSSMQAARICSAVRGLFSAKVFFSPLSFLTQVIASLNAKNTEHPKKSPASPNPLDE